jgi:hypothetical protein
MGEAIDVWLMAVRCKPCRRKGTCLCRLDSSKRIDVPPFVQAILN